MDIAPEKTEYRKDGEQEARLERRPEFVPNPKEGRNHWPVLSSEHHLACIEKCVTG